MNAPDDFLFATIRELPMAVRFGMPNRKAFPDAHL